MSIGIPYNKIKPATAGERLYQRLAGLGLKDLSASRLGQQRFVRLTGRGETFGHYLEGSTVAFAFKRVMKAARGIFDDKTIDAAAGNGRLSGVLHQWFDWLSREELAVLLRDTLRAHGASDNKIPNSVEVDIWTSRRVHTCCFCGARMVADADSIVRDEHGQRATLEHVWPSSLGGDSTEDNLVPACHKCNHKKGDLFTWEQGDIHNFIYPIDFHRSDYLERFPLAHRILLQRKAVLALAQRDSLTLKSALLRVGPYGRLAVVDSSDTWDLFNTQNHSDHLGERLW